MIFWVFKSHFHKDMTLKITNDGFNERFDNEPIYEQVIASDGYKKMQPAQMRCGLRHVRMVWLGEVLGGLRRWSSFKNQEVFVSVVLLCVQTYIFLLLLFVVHALVVGAIKIAAFGDHVRYMCCTI